MSKKSKKSSKSKKSKKSRNLHHPPNSAQQMLFDLGEPTADLVTAEPLPKANTPPPEKADKTLNTVGSPFGFEQKTYEVKLSRDSDQTTAITLPVRPDVDPQQDSELARRYRFCLKSVIFELEKNNTDNLFIYHREDKWWQIGGNSALMFYNQTSHQIGTKPKLREDTDFGKIRWRNGVIIFGQIHGLLKRLTTVKMKPILQTPELIIVPVDEPFSISDLEILSQARETRLERANNIMAAGDVLPKTRLLCDTLCQRIVNLARAEEKTKREYYYDPIVPVAIRLSMSFVELGRTKITAEEFFTRAEADLNQLHNWLAFMERWKLIDIDVYTKLAPTIVELERRMHTEWQKLQTKQDGPTNSIHDAEEVRAMLQKKAQEG